MNLAVVAMSRPNPAFLTSREEKKMLGGVAVADLRRMVIDKMVSSGGWVVNDFVREVNGHRVFVVTARTPKDALTPEKTWTFYFTEAGGRIYGLTTDSPVEFADRMTTEAERFIESLRAKAERQPTVKPFCEASASLGPAVMSPYTQRRNDAEVAQRNKIPTRRTLRCD